MSSRDTCGKCDIYNLLSFIYYLIKSLGRGLTALRCS